MDTLTNLPLSEFIATTASGAPVPGGGSISALCGSLSAALGAMVCRLTIGKKKYAEVELLMADLAAKLDPASRVLMSAVDLDSNAYDMVFQAFKLPKETEEQKAERAYTIEQALKHAADVPLSVCRIVNTFVPDLLEIAQKGNQNAVTDAYVAALCARTAVLGAAANVRINLTSIKDQDYCEAAERELQTIIDAVNDAEHAIQDHLNKAVS